MTIKNIKTNTQPLIAHAQGVEHFSERWRKLCSSDLATSVPKDVTIVTFAKGTRRFELVRQLQESGVPFINAADGTVNYWVNKFKIKYLLDVIDNIKTEYILCLDAIDVILSSDLSDLIKRFEKLDADIVYNATVVDYPMLKIQEETDGPFKYLNAGAFIGRTQSIKEFYKFILDTTYDMSINSRSEQLRVRLAREQYEKKDRIKVDTDCTIFQTLGLVDYETKDNELIV